MGPNTMTPMPGQKSSNGSVWLVVAMVFAAGLAAGVLIPSGLKFLGIGSDSNKISADQGKKDALNLPLPNGKIRRMEPPISNQPVATASESAPEKLEQKATAPSKTVVASAAEKKSKKKNDIRLAKAEKAARAKAGKIGKNRPVDSKKIEDIAVARSAPVTETPASPNGELIEEVPNALSAQQVQKLMTNNGTKAGAIARPVSLPPAAALNAGGISMAHASLAPLPILKGDPKSERKTYPVTLNNASFSKNSLSNCSKRCILMGKDASGNPINAIIDGPTYASALQQHNGTINISGQPRFMKNQQFLQVENITFNLAPIPKATKTVRTRTSALAPAPEAGYTEVPMNDDDLKPGTVIKSRKQIPTEDLEEIPVP